MHGTVLYLGGAERAANRNLSALYSDVVLHRLDRRIKTT